MLSSQCARMARRSTPVLTMKRPSPTNRSPCLLCSATRSTMASWSLLWRAKSSTASSAAHSALRRLWTATLRLEIMRCASGQPLQTSPTFFLSPLLEPTSAIAPSKAPSRSNLLAQRDRLIGGPMIHPCIRRLALGNGPIDGFDFCRGGWRSGTWSIWISPSFR